MKNVSSETSLTDNAKNAPEQMGWFGRTAWDIGIDRDDLSDAAEGSVALAEDPAVTPAIPHCDHQFGRRGCIVGPLQGDLHVPGRRACDKEHVGESGRGGKMDPEPLTIVDGIIQGMDLQLTAIARAGIDRPNGQAPLETPPDGLFQSCPDLFYLLLHPGRQRLRDDPGPKYLMQDS